MLDQYSIGIGPSSKPILRLIFFNIGSSGQKSLKETSDFAGERFPKMMTGASPSHANRRQKRSSRFPTGPEFGSPKWPTTLRSHN